MPCHHALAQALRTYIVRTASIGSDWRSGDKGLTSLFGLALLVALIATLLLGKPTVKLHLAAIRMLLDWLVVGRVLAVNPAHAVRGPKHFVRRGKTPVLTEDQARRLLESIDASTVVGLRDRALIGVMTYAFARIGAVVAMKVEDYYPEGKRWWVRLHEKGGKRHEMPAHHKLEAFIDEYLAAAGIREDGKTPLFRSAIGKTGVLTDKPMNRVDAYRMIRRRTADAGFKQKLGCHVFRATGITAYLEAGGTLENAQAMAAHESPRTTKLYDRTADAVTLDEVERIRGRCTICSKLHVKQGRVSFLSGRHPALHRLLSLRQAICSKSCAN
jgi:site-specific recombinase XerC